METRAQMKVNPFKKGLRIFAMVMMGAIGASAMAVIFGYFVMLLWNWLMPELFGLPIITFWKAAGIVILARLVFGGFKHHPDRPMPSSECRPFSKENKMERWMKYGRTCKSDKWNKWKHYDEFWEKEGKEAFDEFIKNKEEGQTEE